MNAVDLRGEVGLGSVRERIEGLARLVEQEILDTDTVTVGGVPAPVNSRRRTPYDGLCGLSVERLGELAPDLRIRTFSFQTQWSAGHPAADIWDCSRHAMAEIITREGTFYVDPTLRQYFPDITDLPLVYGQDDQYPLIVPQDSVQYF